MTINITNGDCLKLMKDLPDKSVDLFICDLPYGETNCKWDCVIDLEEFWKEFKRLRKSKRTACIHFCSTKFGYTLIKSWEKGFKMDMVWKKRNKTGGLQSRHRPMRNHEMVYFFYEQAPKYNRDKYHKRIQAKKEHNIEKECVYGNTSKMGKPVNHFDPPNPASVVEEKPKKNKTIKAKDRKAMGESSGIYAKENQTVNSFEPPNPASVVEEKTTYGISKEKAQKSGRKDFKGIGTQNAFEPPNPASVLEEETTYGISKDKCLESRKNGFGNNGYEPPNPASVLEEKTTYGIDKSIAAKSGADISNMKCSFEPPNPASVLEEKEAKSQKEQGRKKYTNTTMGDIYLKKAVGPVFDPPNPASVLEEKTTYGIDKSIAAKSGAGYMKCSFEPPNPASVVEEFIEPAEDEPKSMFESKKVFIGKRHHQTEKPLDILEFFIKYWTDEDDVILDPTMGSGSTGVACKSLKRNFIGYELNEDIYKVATKRLFD